MFPAVFWLPISLRNFSHVWRDLCLNRVERQSNYCFTNRIEEIAMKNVAFTIASLMIALSVNNYATGQDLNRYDQLLNRRNLIADQYNAWYDYAERVERYYEATGDSRAYNDLLQIDRRLVSLYTQIEQFDQTLDRMEYAQSASQPNQYNWAPGTETTSNGNSGLMRVLDENAQRYVPTPGEGPTMVAPTREESLRGGR
jgi:hypothetical protein